MKATLSVLLFILINLSLYSQERGSKFYILWGYNRAVFSPSNIHFKGENIDFTLLKVKAKDRPTPFDLSTYINPQTMWIPQYNYRIGYHINNKFAISVGTDHMKYIVNQYQDVKFKGDILLNNSRRHSEGAEVISITPDFLEFEHTDGFNYINTQLERTFVVHTFSDNFSFNFKIAPGIGVMIPRTSAKLMGYEKSDKFHFAGLGASVALVPHFQFFKHFFIQSEWKTGYVNMFDVIVNENVKARHKVFFEQYNISVGASFNIARKNKA